MHQRKYDVEESHRSRIGKDKSNDHHHHRDKTSRNHHPHHHQNRHHRLSRTQNIQ